MENEIFVQRSSSVQSLPIVLVLDSPMRLITHLTNRVNPLLGVKASEGMGAKQGRVGREVFKNGKCRTGAQKHVCLQSQPRMTKSCLNGINVRATLSSTVE